MALNGDEIARTHSIRGRRMFMRSSLSTAASETVSEAPTSAKASGAAADPVLSVPWNAAREFVVCSVVCSVVGTVITEDRAIVSSADPSWVSASAELIDRNTRAASRNLCRRY